MPAGMVEGRSLKPLRKVPKGPLHVMAYGVHVLTALGAALGFLALEAVINGDLTLAFLWLATALLVDAVDGPLARWLNVSETASRYDGSLLDLVVDFITYVFVPAAMLLRPEVMPHPYGLVAGLIVLVGSALYFADTQMKTEDWWFKGFPAVWNVVIFYIVLFKPAALVSLTIVIVLAAMMFLPVVFVHPVRVKRWRALTMGVLVLWCMAAGWALWQKLDPGFICRSVLLGGAVYFLGLGFLRDLPEEDPA